METAAPYENISAASKADVRTRRTLLGPWARFSPETSFRPSWAMGMLLMLQVVI